MLNYNPSVIKRHIYSAPIHSKSIMLYFVFTLVYIYIKLTQIYITPVVFSDTNSYVRLAQHSLFDIHIYMADRPFTYPLLLKLFSSNNSEVIVFQVVFSIISWIFLALVLAKLFNIYAIQYSVYITMLLFSLSVTITQWDTMILTESISFSLFAIFLGLNILFVTSRLNKKIMFPLIIVVGILFSFARDSNSYVLLQISIVYLIVYITHISLNYLKNNTISVYHLPYIALTIAFFIIYHIQKYLIVLSHRTFFNLMNIFGIRILTNKEYAEYFITTWGMPLNEDILQCSGHYASAVQCNYANQSIFRDWVKDKGFDAYRSFITSHLLDVVHVYSGLIPSSLNYTPIYTSDIHYSDIYFSIPQNIFYTNRWDTLFSAFVAILVVIILLFVIQPYLINDYLNRYLIVISLFFVSLGQVFIGYFGDSMEIQRHSLLATISFKLSFILLAFIIIELLIRDYLIKRRRE